MNEPFDSAQGQRGQILVIAVLLLCVLAIIVPVLVMYSQRESRWSVLQSRNNTAFHQAEAGTERGYYAITLSTTVYQSVQYGSALTGYNYDYAYSDISGGKYAIKITSGAGIGQVVITSIGKDTSGNSLRAIEATYSNAPFGNVAIWANGGVAVTGNNFTVEWGAVMTPKSIVIAGRDYPQLWSAGSIDEDTNGPTPPNTDSNACFWHSYNSSIPPTPTIDFAYYKALAQASGTYYSGNTTWPSMNDGTGKTWYVDGNLAFGSNNNYIKGNVVVIGDASPPNGNWGDSGGANIMPQMPSLAWKQYCNSWSTYQAYDTAEPASFPGLTSTYESDPTLTPVTLTKVAVYGFFYVGGNLLWGGGGGNADFIGVVYVNGSASLGANSHANIWYNGDVSAGIKSTNVILQRTSWKELKKTWPGGI